MTSTLRLRFVQALLGMTKQWFYSFSDSLKRRKDEGRNEFFGWGKTRGRIFEEMVRLTGVTMWKPFLSLWLPSTSFLFSPYGSFNGGKTCWP